MVCYVCGSVIHSNEFYFQREELGRDARRHAWHGLPQQYPYVMHKPTLRTAFEWAERFNLVIVRPNGFDPKKSGAPRVTDLISYEAFEFFGKKHSVIVNLKAPAKVEPEPNMHERGMTMGPFNRPR